MSEFFCVGLGKIDRRALFQPEEEGGGGGGGGGGGVGY